MEIGVVTATAGNGILMKAATAVDGTVALAHGLRPAPLGSRLHRGTALVAHAIRNTVLRRRHASP